MAFLQIQGVSKQYGGLWALASFAVATMRTAERGDAYPQLRRRLGRDLELFTTEYGFIRTPWFGKTE